MVNPSASVSDQRKPVLVVTLQLLEPVEERMAREYQLRRAPADESWTVEDLLAAADGADALFVTSSNHLDKQFFERLARSVKVISTYSVGVEHIDIQAARIPIGYTPGVLTDATAEIALLLLLGAARRAYEAQQLLRKGEWPKTKSSNYLGRQLTGKRLGIYGMGRIGSAVADRARSFGMEIHYNNRHRLSPAEEKGATFHASPESLLRHSDFLSLNAPNTPETKRFLNASRLTLLPAGAIVVNTARGDLIDDDALIDALQSGRLAAAGLDVFTGEPNVDPRYLDLPNVYILPHIGSATFETRVAMGMLALDNIAAVLEGRPGPAIVPETLRWPKANE